MNLITKIGKSFTYLPLFFQIFAVACSLMLALAVYGFVISSFREARIFLYSGLTGFLVFALINLATSNRNLKESGLTQLISLLLLFMLLPLFLAFPCWIILSDSSFLDSYLDMVGAFTTTGLSVFEDDLLTRPIRLWRAVIAWFGGGLIWIAAFVILLPAGRSGFDVLSNKNINPNVKRNLTLNERSLTLAKISKKLIPIYIGLTFFLWCALIGLGTDGYTSLIRAFSILSTSGLPGPVEFQSDGAGFFGEFVMAIFLLLALSHNIFYTFIREFSIKNFKFDKEMRLGLFLVFCITILLSFKDISLISSESNLYDSLVSGLRFIWGNFFTVFSFLTTNGYVSAYWSGVMHSINMPHITTILLGLCLFGGGVATTAGGIKLLRISVLFSAFSKETGKLLHPSSMAGLSLDNKILEISVFTAWIFFMLFIVSLAVVTVILAMFGLLFDEALVLAVACLTTTGPLIEVLGIETSLISELSNFAKLVLALSMVLGRLEILIALSVMSSALNRD